ncbi:MAG: CBS domain-containing protein [Myxococcaceae bacterium]
MKPIPPISKYMTTLPVSVEKSRSLAEMRDLMKAKGIRHVPVLDQGKVLGVVSERDIHLVSAMQGVDAKSMTAEAIMQRDVFAVKPESTLDEVAEQMAEHKYGSAVVLHNGTLVGIVTTVDICRALSDLLHTRLR